MIRTRLILPSPVGEAPAFVLLGMDGEVIDRGVLNGASGEPTRDVLVAPGSEVASRWLDLPARASEEQVRSAARFLLEDELTGLEAAEMAVGEAASDGRRLVAVAARADLERWVEQARAWGAVPALVTPDYLMLPEPSDESLVTAEIGGLVAVRGRGVGFSAEADLTAAIIGERPARPLTQAELEAALAGGAAEPPVNLLPRTPTAKALQPRDLRRAAALAAVLAISPLVLLAASMTRDLTAASRLEEKARTRAAAVLPQATREGDPAALVNGEMARLRAADAFPQLAAGLFAAVEQAGAIQMDSLVYSPDGAIRASVVYANYSDMDQLRAAASAQRLDVEETGTATASNGRIVSDLIVRERP